MAFAVAQPIMIQSAMLISSPMFIGCTHVLSNLQSNHLEWKLVPAMF
jgi:hypothetical protein